MSFYDNITKYKQLFFLLLLLLFVLISRDFSSFRIDVIDYVSNKIKVVSPFDTINQWSRFRGIYRRIKPEFIWFIDFKRVLSESHYTRIHFFFYWLPISIILNNVSISSDISCLRKDKWRTRHTVMYQHGWIYLVNWFKKR